MTLPVPNGSAPRTILVIMNPAAGRRRRAFFEAVLREVRAGGAGVTVRETTGPGHAELLARDAIPEHFDVIVAAGGDGTINEVINGLTGTPQVFAILPLGTANVLAAEIGLAADAAAVARVIASGQPRPVHFARAGGRVFALMAGAGLDARIVAGVDLGLKRRLGKLAYAWQALREIFTYRPMLYEIELEGQRLRAAGVVVAKGHFYGGRFVCAPQACLAEPRLHVCLFIKPGRLNAARYALALVLGRLGRMSERDYRVLPALTLRISGASSGERMQIDGDVGVLLPASLAVIEEPFLLLAPPS